MEEEEERERDDPLGRSTIRLSQFVSSTCLVDARQTPAA